MDYLTPDWNQQKPTAASAREALASERLEVAPFRSAALDELLASLCASHSNGGAVFGRWRLPTDPMLHWYVSRNRLDEMGFFAAFLTAHAVRRELHALRVPAVLSAPPKFEWTSSFTLDGEIARIVYAGGAYSSHEPASAAAAAAKGLGVAFCESLFGHRFAEIEVHRTHDPWTPWFFSIAWDVTWFGLDKRDRTAWLLCVTDTD